jgi:hypothetical protein
MNRIKDYTGFAAWFVGLGYIVLWPLTSSELGGHPFGASVMCHDNTPELLDFVCNSTHLLSMPPGLHALGFMSAIFVTTRLLISGAKRSRRAVKGRTSVPSLPAAQTPHEPPPPRRSPRPQRPAVKPRTHFGLRGVPR